MFFKHYLTGSPCEKYVLKFAKKFQCLLLLRRVIHLPYKARKLFLPHSVGLPFLVTGQVDRGRRCSQESLSRVKG